MGILGIVCNSLVFVTLLSGYLHRGSHSAHLFANLAFVDTFLSAFLVFPLIGKVINQHFSSQSVTQTACSVWLSGILLFAAASIYTVTAVCMDRHMGILHPLRRAIVVRSHGSFKRITGVWVLAVAISTPLWSGWLHTRVPACASLLQCRFYEPMWYFVTAAVLIYFCPLCIMVVSYYRVYRTIRHRFKVLSMGCRDASCSSHKGGWALRIHVGTPRVSVQTNVTIEEDLHSRYTDKKTSVSSRQPEKNMSITSRHTEKGMSTTMDHAEIFVPKSPSSFEKFSFANTSTSQTGAQSSFMTSSQTYTSTLDETPKNIPPDRQSSNSSQSVTFRVKKMSTTSREAGRESPQASKATSITFQGLIMSQVPHGSTTDSSPYKLRRADQDSTMTTKTRPTRTSRFFNPRGTWTDMNTDINKKHCQGLTKTTVILLTIMGFFMLFWMPFFAMLPLCHVEGWGKLSGIYEDWCTTSHWWALLHSLANPFIYVWIRADYRRATKCLLSCKPRKETEFLMTASPLTFSPTDPRAAIP